MKKETESQITKIENKPISSDLIGDICSLIETARHNIAVTVNAGLTILYWQIGNRILHDILKEKRAKYGEEILPTLSAKLVPEFGSGFSVRNISRMVRFAEVFPEGEIVVTLSRQLSWSHFVAILPFKDDLQRNFYAEMCRVERWSVRTLRKKIDGMLYERTAISKKPEELVKKELSALREEDRLTPDLVFRDPYFLDFLGLKDTFSEKDLESSILREMESFILELGVGFSFVARQKRIAIDNEDYYLDLLFFHRKLKRLIAIELKLGKFKAAYKG
jgi:predicted nuclease of restriction endonuclease-like (RecB) superfamily